VYQRVPPTKKLTFRCICDMIRFTTNLNPLPCCWRVMLMSTVIDTDSFLFKLYANRRMRKGPHWDIEDVIKYDADEINICSYAREIVLECANNTKIVLLKLFGGLLLSFMVLVPLVSLFAYLITDNGWITVFGLFGYIIMVLDASVLSMLLGIGCVAVIGWGGNKISNNISNATQTLSASSTLILWMRNKHGKFCTKLSFDRESTNNTDDEYDDIEDHQSSAKRKLDVDWTHE